MKRTSFLAAALLLTACAPKPPSGIPSTASPSTPRATMTASSTPISREVPGDGLRLWLRAETGVTQDQGKVKSWKSQGHGQLEAQCPAGRPVVVAGAIGGKDAIRFSGENEMLEIPLDINPDKVPQLTVVTVFSSQTEDAQKLRKVYGHDDGGYDRAVGLDHRSKTNFALFAGTEVLPYFDLKARKVYLVVDEYAGEKFNGWVNGSQLIKQAPIKHDRGLEKFYLGGTGTAYDEFWQGDIAELLVYDRKLADEERKSLEKTLAQRYQVKLETASAPSP